MSKTKALWIGATAAALMVCGFLAGTTRAQQLLPTEHMAAYSFPKAWGDLSSVTAAPSGRGLAYVFVAADGAIRVVQTNPAGPEQIEVITRR